MCNSTDSSNFVFFTSFNNSIASYNVYNFCVSIFFLISNIRLLIFLNPLLYIYPSITSMPILRAVPSTTFIAASKSVVFKSGNLSLAISLT